MRRGRGRVKEADLLVEGDLLHVRLVVVAQVGLHATVGHGAAHLQVAQDCSTASRCQQRAKSQGQ